MTEVPAFSGCPWPIDPACLGEQWEGLDATVQERAVALATATLQRLTGNRVTNCPVMVRPCNSSCCGERMPYFSTFGTNAFYPFLDAGRWVNTCGHSHDCGCEYVCSVSLPPPVGRVDEVMIDGQPIDPSWYRLVGHALVAVLNDGEECFFPAKQDISKPDTEPGTFSITYLNGYEPDGLAAYAAGVMANEYAKACSGQKCRLPMGVTSLTRQGVTMEVTTGAFPGGLTGIREVDSFITLWNPDGLVRAPQVWYPGMPTQGKVHR